MEAGMMKTVLTNKSARSNRHHPLHRVEAGKIFQGNTRGNIPGENFRGKIRVEFRIPFPAPDHIPYRWLGLEAPSGPCSGLPPRSLLPHSVSGAYWGGDNGFTPSEEALLL